MRAVLLFLFCFASPLFAADFPVRIHHAYGETEVTAPPKRVVSVGYHEQDFLYALGVKPIGVHEWFGDYPFATWPWAEALRQDLGEAPEVQRGFEIDLEWVLMQQPDLIVATFAPLDARSYAMLSRIAPVVAPPADYPMWGAPWEEELRLIAAATGTAEEAEEIIANLGARIATARAEHPELEGLSGTVAHYAGGQIVGYRTQDGGNRLLHRLGIETPASFDDMAGPGGNFTVSPERIDLFDLDVVLWLTDAPARQRIESLPGYDALRITTEGRSIWADEVLTGALSFQSPLSIAWALEVLIPALAAAADGNPATQPLE